MIYSTDADQNTTHLITGKNVAVDNRKTGLSIIHELSVEREQPSGNFTPPRPWRPGSNNIVSTYVLIICLYDPKIRISGNPEDFWRQPKDDRREPRSLLQGLNPGNKVKYQCEKTETFLERFAFQGEGQLREGKLNHKQQPLTSLWFRGLLAFPDLFRDWSQHHIHSWNTPTCSRNTGLCSLCSWRGIVMSAPIEEEELRIYEENRGRRFEIRLGISRCSYARMAAFAARRRTKGHLH